MPNDIQSIPDKPGLKLDVLVGREVMAWRYSTDDEYHHFQFSTTWEGMRLVVQEMNRRGYGFSLFCEDGEWSSDFWQRTSSDGTTHNTADDLEFAPHAVAIAAIKAIRGGDKSMP